MRGDFRVVSHRQNFSPVTAADFTGLIVEQHGHLQAFGHFGEAQGGVNFQREINVGVRRFTVANAIEEVFLKIFDFADCGR